MDPDAVDVRQRFLRFELSRRRCNAVNGLELRHCCDRDLKMCEVRVRVLDLEVQFTGSTSNNVKRWWVSLSLSSSGGPVAKAKMENYSNFGLCLRVNYIYLPEVCN